MAFIGPLIVCQSLLSQDRAVSQPFPYWLISGSEKPGFSQNPRNMHIESLQKDFKTFIIYYFYVYVPVWVYALCVCVGGYSPRAWVV